MAFTSLTFLFLFLPVALLLSYLVPQQMTRVHTILLIVLSLLFYAWGDITSLPILLLSVGFNYASGRLLSGLPSDSEGRFPISYRTLVLISTVVIDVGMLAVFKYSGLSQPVGVSFYTFSVLSYIFDIYREEAVCADFLTDACYITFFPKLVSGPIVRYRDMQEAILERTRGKADMLLGVNQFLIGMFKKVLLADNLGVAFNQIYSLQKMSGMTAWLGMIYYGLQLYFDFSGYSDMAIGLARMFGFRFDANFRYPYTAVSIGDFWRKWHISLGTWFREYVYIPLGGNRCSTVLQVRNLAAVWLLTGIWHGNTLNYVFWGIYHGAFVMLERFVLRDYLERIPRIVRIILTDLLVFIGWVFFFNPSMGTSLGYLGKMFGMDGMGFFDGAAFYYLRNNLILLAASFVGIGPWIHNLYDRIVFKQGRFNRGAVALFVVLLIFSTAYMVGSTYQTFMYFKF